MDEACLGCLTLLSGSRQPRLKLPRLGIPCKMAPSGPGPTWRPLPRQADARALSDWYREAWWLCPAGMSCVKTRSRDEDVGTSDHEVPPLASSFYSEASNRPIRSLSGDFGAWPAAARKLSSENLVAPSDSFALSRSTADKAPLSTRAGCRLRLHVISHRLRDSTRPDMRRPPTCATQPCVFGAISSGSCHWSVMH